MRNRNHKEKQPGAWLMQGGLLLIAAAVLLTGYNLWDDWRANKAAGQVLEQMYGMVGTQGQSSADPDEQKIPDYILNPDMEMPTVEVDGHDYIGTLDIPSLQLSLPVMNDWSYPQLKISPCRYAGTAYQSGFVIAGHNYRRHFGLLSCLAAGDCVIFTDVDGNMFYYQVEEIQILEPAEIEDMITGDWDLSLFTCTLGGRTRLTVRCDKCESYSIDNQKGLLTEAAKENEEQGYESILNR